MEWKQLLILLNYTFIKLRKQGLDMSQGWMIFLISSIKCFLKINNCVAFMQMFLSLLFSFKSFKLNMEKQLSQMLNSIHNPFCIQANFYRPIRIEKLLLCLGSFRVYLSRLGCNQWVWLDLFWRQVTPERRRAETISWSAGAGVLVAAPAPMRSLLVIWELRLRHSDTSQQQGRSHQPTQTHTVGWYVRIQNCNHELFLYPSSKMCICKASSVLRHTNFLSPNQRQWHLKP